ncbi:hypothetical protein D3C86_1567460 [compost metagenome]
MAVIITGIIAVFPDHEVRVLDLLVKRDAPERAFEVVFHWSNLTTYLRIRLPQGKPTPSAKPVGFRSMLLTQPRELDAGDTRGFYHSVWLPQKSAKAKP